MHISELKETIEKKFKEVLGISYFYETNYGDIAKETFLYSKQVMLINTKEKTIEGDSTYILTIANPLSLETDLADIVYNKLTCIQIPSEVWLDDVKVREGSSIKNLIGTGWLVAICYDRNYYIKEGIKAFCHQD